METTEPNQTGRLGKTNRPAKTQITLRLDSDIVGWFRSYVPGGRGYQTEINRVLREYVAGYEKSENRR